MRRNRTKAGEVAGAASLPSDMLAHIHRHLTLLDRLAFAAAFPASRDAFRPEAPWLLLPGEVPTLFSLADSRYAAAVRGPGADHAVIGSSSAGGWIVTADCRARMHLVNPVTGEQHALPDITTIPCLFTYSGGASFTLDLKHFVSGPPYHYSHRGHHPPQGGLTIPAETMHHFFYRKVVLSDSSPRPAAMLITGPTLGVAAFAMGDGGVWRLASPSSDGVEDAIYHNGQFYSITYSGDVEAWEHDADSGVVTKAVVTPRLLDDANRKYLVAAMDGRLMVVLKDSEEATEAYRQPRWTCSFKVHVLHGEEWKETDDIGDAALFVGVNSSLCVSTREHPKLRAGCIYYIEDGLKPHSDTRHHNSLSVGVFSLKDGTTEKVEGLGQHRSWPPPVWFRPSIP